MQKITDSRYTLTLIKLILEISSLNMAKYLLIVNIKGAILN